MVRSVVFPTLLALLALTGPVAAHPAPFTYLDIHIQPNALELSLVAHVFDVAHDTGIDKPERLLEEAGLREGGPKFARLLTDRIRLSIDGRAATIEPWTAVELLPDRQGIRLASRVALTSDPGVVELTAHLFPYDPAHQTFVNVHERDAVASQTILDGVNRHARHYAGTPWGSWAAVRALVPGGFLHVLMGPEHIVMLVGLLLIGVSRRQLFTIVAAFVGGHLATLSLALFAFWNPPARLIDPALALAIVYIGMDNLMASGGRDVRSWMSLACGAIHGFGFATVLRSMSLSRPALLWSAATVHVGVGTALLLLGLIVAAAIGAVARTRVPAERLVVTGSIPVIVLGAAWFVQRVFFPGVAFPGLMARL